MTNLTHVLNECGRNRFIAASLLFGVSCMTIGVLIGIYLSPVT